MVIDAFGLGISLEVMVHAYTMDGGYPQALCDAACLHFAFGMQGSDHSDVYRGFAVQMHVTRSANLCGNLTNRVCRLLAIVLGGRTSANRKAAPKTDFPDTTTFRHSLSQLHFLEADIRVAKRVGECKLTPMKLLPAAFMLVLSFGFADPAMAGHPERKLLGELKAACGGSAWDRAQGWHETSEATIKGMPPIRNEVWHDLKSLKSAMTSTVNDRVFRRTGFNGTIAWRGGPDGQVKLMSEESDLRRQRRDVYLSSFGWFFPKRFPAQFELLADANRDGQSYRVLRITPRNAEPLELWIDPKSMLVRRITAGAEYAELSDYKTFGRVCTATVGRQGDGKPENEIVLRVLDVQTSKSAPAAAFDPPKQ